MMGAGAHLNSHSEQTQFIIMNIMNEFNTRSKFNHKPQPNAEVLYPGSNDRLYEGKPNFQGQERRQLQLGWRQGGG